jgi:hypothetical protein
MPVVGAGGCEEGVAAAEDVGQSLEFRVELGRGVLPVHRVEGKEYLTLTHPTFTRTGRPRCCVDRLNPQADPRDPS